MGPSQPEPPRRSSARYLVIGFVCTLVLAVLALGVSAIELARFEHTTLDLADDSQHVTYYLGGVSAQLGRLRSRAALGLQDSPDELSHRAGMISNIEQLVQRAHDALPATIDPAAQQQWAALGAEVGRLRQIYTDAAAAIRNGRPANPDLAASEAAAATRVHDVLDDLQQMHNEAVLAQLRAAHRTASRMVLLELVLAAIFLAGMVVIWGVVIRVLRRQRDVLSEYTARLESANADLDNFAGRVAHDLRNALATADMGPSLLRRMPLDQARVVEIADRLERGSKRALALVDTLLAFSRASRSVEADESAALPPTVKDVLEELEPQIARLGVTVEVDELPDLHVRCSPGLLHIVLANLCGNAVKFLDGQEVRHVRVSAHREESSCRIDVEDTGPGIPAEAREQIFKPFFRVAGSRVPGSGIGLATVHRIVSARGGRITVEPGEGRGARFHVWLPLARPPER